MLSRYTLLTGATGLVGRYLLRDLLSAGHRLAVVVRPTAKETAAQRIESILQQWEKELQVQLPRPVVMTGDLNQPGLGLSLADRRWAAAHCDRIFHNAASLTFHGQDRAKEPWLTNLTGTEEMLKLCRELHLADLHYVSTAYVCGNRQDRIYEHELDVGQGFRNDYERSKLEAETRVRNADFLDQLTIYRPAVISGDSETGYTSTYHGLYVYLKFVSVLLRHVEPDANGVRHTPVRLRMSGDERRNIVPVDWVSSVMQRLFETEAAHGGTYHLAPSDPLTPRQLIEWACQYYKSEGVEFLGPEANIDNPNELEQMFDSSLSIYASYDTTDPDFDTTECRKFTADLPCPAIDRDVMFSYIQHGEQDRWGNRKHRPASVSFSVGEHLSRLVVPANGHAGSPLRTVGLDVWGPGGGQWHLGFRSDHLVSVERGLTADCLTTLRLSADDFAQGVARQRVLRPGEHIECVGQPANGLLDTLTSALGLGPRPVPVVAVEAESSLEVPREPRPA